MGAAFGLLGMLVTVAIILYLMVGTGYTGAVAKQNQVARQQIHVMSGKDPTGQKLAIETIHTRIDRTGGRPKLFASEVERGGAMEERYGIRPGDQIMEIGGLDFVTNIGTRDAANDWIATAYARNQPIVVIRNGEKLSLPTPEHLVMIQERNRKATIAAAQEAAAAQAAPPPPAPPKEEDLSTLQKAIDKIRSTPGR